MSFHWPLTHSLSKSVENIISQLYLHYKPYYKRRPIRRFPNCCQDAGQTDTKGRQHNTTHPHSTGHQGEKKVLTLSFEFPNNYSQKCVLWRNMTPPDRHGSPLKNKDKKIFGCPSNSKPVLRQVLAGDNQSQRGSPFPLSPVSHPRKKISPSAFFPPRPPVFPLFQLRCVPGCAHRRGFPALLADVKLKRKESVNRSLTNISPSLFESTVRVLWPAREWMRVYCCERKTDGLWGQWLRGWQTRRGATPTLRREKPTWMRRQSGWRERQGCLVMDYCSALERRQLTTPCLFQRGYS